MSRFRAAQEVEVKEASISCDLARHRSLEAIDLTFDVVPQVTSAVWAQKVCSNPRRHRSKVFTDSSASAVGQTEMEIELSSQRESKTQAQLWQMEIPADVNK